MYPVLGGLVLRSKWRFHFGALGPWVIIFDDLCHERVDISTFVGEFGKGVVN